MTGEMTSKELLAKAKRVSELLLEQEQEAGIYPKAQYPDGCPCEVCTIAREIKNTMEVTSDE